MIALLLSLLFAAQDPAVARNGTITGILTTEAGVPASGVRVFAIEVPRDPADTSKTLVSLDETDEQGRYVLENVPPGRYYVMAGSVDRPTFYPGRMERASGTVLNVSSSLAISGINFVVNDASIAPAPPAPPPVSLRRAAISTIKIQVQVEGGGPHPPSGTGQSALIQLIAADGAQKQEALLSDNRIFVPDGEYQVRIANLPNGYVVKSVSFNGQDLTNEMMKLPVSGPPRIVTYTGDGKLQEAADQAVQKIAAAATLSITLAPTPARE